MFQILYRVTFDDGRVVEPGEHSLDDLADEEKTTLVANGWAVPLGDTPIPALVVNEPMEDAPLALTHWEGVPDAAPPGTWEYHNAHPDEPDAAPYTGEKLRRKSRKSEE